MILELAAIALRLVLVQAHSAVTKRELISPLVVSLVLSISADEVHKCSSNKGGGREASADEIKNTKIRAKIKLAIVLFSTLIAIFLLDKVEGSSLE